MKKVSYTLIIIAVIAFLLLSIEIMGAFEPSKVKLYGSVFLLTLIIGLVLNLIGKYRE